MRNHPIRKFLGLTVLYAVIIIGIFILQFKTESLSTINVGLMKILLAQTEGENNTISLRNQLEVNFRGLTFVANEKNPVTVVSDAAEPKPLVLSDFLQPNELSALFVFDDSSSLLFELSDDTPDALLTVTAKTGSGSGSINLPYKTGGGYTVNEMQENKILLSSKENTYSLTAASLSAEHIGFTQSEYTFSYSVYNPIVRFTFDSVTDYPLADAGLFNSTVRLLRGELVSRFNQVLESASVSSLSENDVIAYVAEMAYLDRYDEAIKAVPDSFKKGNKRTYLSSPYFNNLTVMNKSLVMQTEKFESMVNTAVLAQELDIFTVDGICDYIIREKFNPKIQQLLSFPATMDSFAPTVNQSAALLWTYSKLSENNIPQSSFFEPVLPLCIKTLEDSSKDENQKLTLYENEKPLDLLHSFQAGRALVAYGKKTDSDAFIKAGYLIINTALSEITPSSLELSQLSALYPMMCTNSFYPHTVVLDYIDKTPVWAWTCANGITYDTDADGTVNINIDFPLGKSHHIIFNGIPDFHYNIEIQKQKFRTDPRFETYNSSGYIYNTDSHTLFIKSRHKEQKELIRLFCGTK